MILGCNAFLIQYIECYPATYSSMTWDKPGMGDSIPVDAFKASLAYWFASLCFFYYEAALALLNGISGELHTEDSNRAQSAEGCLFTLHVLVLPQA